MKINLSHFYLVCFCSHSTTKTESAQNDLGQFFVTGHLLFACIQVLIISYNICFSFLFVFLSCPKQPDQEDLQLEEVEVMN